MVIKIANGTITNRKKKNQPNKRTKQTKKHNTTKR